jgi:hypothetical protein
MNVYIPFVSSSPPRRGIGIPSDHANAEDVTKLGCSFWYDWGCGPLTPGYVPMSWAGGMVVLPVDYSGYLLVLNEPENSNQANLTPGTAVGLVLLLAHAYPLAKLIIGGTGYGGFGWLMDFVQALGDYRPAGWHVHGYTEIYAGHSITADMICKWWSDARVMTGGGDFWITEMADCTGDLDSARKLMTFCERNAWVTRYAWFANRLTGHEWYYPQGWHNPALIDDNGLTQLGKMYIQDNR